VRVHVQSTGAVTVRFHFYFVLTIDFTTLAESNVDARDLRNRAQIWDCSDKSRKFRERGKNGPMIFRCLRSRDNSDIDKSSIIIGDYL
jgi:hypothetical protein